MHDSVLAISSASVSPLIRVASDAPETLKRALDTGTQYAFPLPPALPLARGPAMSSTADADAVLVLMLMLIRMLMLMPIAVSSCP